MPLSTEGWIEYCPSPTKEEKDEENSWMTWMNIASIVYLNDELTELIFGYSKRILREEFIIESIAHDRGFPSNPSKTVRDEIDEIKKFEVQYGAGEIFGFTHIYYNEITESISFDKFKESEWIKLFELIDHFKKIKNLNNDQLRLIVWFNW